MNHDAGESVGSLGANQHSWRHKVPEVQPTGNDGIFHPLIAGVIEDFQMQNEDGWEAGQSSPDDRISLQRKEG